MRLLLIIGSNATAGIENAESAEPMRYELSMIFNLFKLLRELIPDEVTLLDNLRRGVADSLEFDCPRKGCKASACVASNNIDAESKIQLILYL